MNKMPWCEVAEGSRGLAMLMLMSWEGKSGFYSQCSREPLKVFKQGSDTIRLALGRAHGGS